MVFLWLRNITTARVGTANDSWHGIIVFLAAPVDPLTPSTPAKGAPSGGAVLGGCPRQAVAAAALIPAPSRPLARQGGMPWPMTMASGAYDSARPMAVCNTFFRHRDAQTATWRSPNGRDWATLDYVLINQPYFGSVRDCRSLPDAVTHYSDHNLVVCILRLRLPNTARRTAAQARPPRINVSALKSKAACEAFQASINAAAMERAKLPRPDPC